jgi:acetyl-CoA carboxylase biotin carboxyl carrier protein
MKVNSSMSGSVFKINVSVGATVNKGDELIVLESMKMEIPIPAETSGTVKEIKVNEGDFVQEGETVAVVE